MIELLLATWILEDLVGLEFLPDLSVVYLFFYRVVYEQSVDYYISFLAYAEGTVCGLRVDHRVPIRIKYNDFIGTREVDSEAADFCRQAKQEDVLVRVVLLYDGLPAYHWHVAIHSAIPVTSLLYQFLNHVKHLFCSAKYEHLVWRTWRLHFLILLVPIGQKIEQPLHLAGHLPVLNACIKVDVMRNVINLGRALLALLFPGSLVLVQFEYLGSIKLRMPHLCCSCVCLWAQVLLEKQEGMVAYLAQVVDRDVRDVTAVGTTFARYAGEHFGDVDVLHDVVEIGFVDDQLRLGHATGYDKLVPLWQLAVIVELAPSSSKYVVLYSLAQFVYQPLGGLLLEFVGAKVATFYNLTAEVFFEGFELAEEAALDEVEESPQLF